MKTRKIQITSEKLDEMMAFFLNLPAEPIGNHLSDDEFVRYVMDDLSEEEIQKIDEHLGSCLECSTEVECLDEASEAWRGGQGKQRLDTLKSFCLLSKALNQATENLRHTAKLVAQHPKSYRVWEWQNDIIHISLSQDMNENWTFWFSSNDLGLQEKCLRLRLVSLERKATLRRVSRSEVGAKVTVPSYERPSSISEISFRVDKEDFLIQVNIG